MRRGLHLLLCWLLLAALPLQGWAAAHMSLCATAHAGLGAARDPAAPAAAPHAPCHAHGQPGHHGDGHGAANMPTDAEPGHDVGGVRELSMPSPGSGSCTVCAWCAHIVSSLPTAGCACPAAEVGRAFEPVRRALPALSFLTPGLERPPR